MDDADIAGAFADPSGTQPPRGLLAAAVTYGTSFARPWPDLMSESEGRAALRSARHHKLLETLALAVDDGAWALPDTTRAALTEEHRWSQINALHVERTLLRCLEIFESEQIPFRVLKGLAYGRLLHTDPAWRSAGDLDVLVPAQQIEDAVTALVDQLDGMQAIPDVREGFLREFGKEAVVRVGPVQVDVHRALVSGPIGFTIDPEDLLRRPGLSFNVGDRFVEALEEQHVFIHACINLAIGDVPARLGALRDMLLTHERLGVDHDAAIEQARQWQCLAVLQRAGALADVVLDTTDTWIEGLCALRPSARERRMLRSYLAPGASYRKQLAALTVIPGLGPRARYLRALVFPSDDYLYSRSLNRSAHARRAVRRLRGRD